MRHYEYCLRVLLLLVFVGVFCNLKAQSFVFASLEGAPVNTTGWALSGAAYVGNITGNNNSEVVVCPTNGSSGAIFYQQPINLSLCNKWKAEFDFRLYDGTGADGLAFCFLDVPPTGFVTGGGLGIPRTANGLKICFDTWNNCIPFNAATVHNDMPKVEIRYGQGYDECSTQPTTFNTGQLSFIVNGNYHHALIEYNDGLITVSVDGTPYATGNQKFDFAGYLGFTASTGGYRDNHSIKNVKIYTDMPPSVAGPVSMGFCPGTTVQLGVTPNPDYVYSWLPATGLSAGNIANPVATTSNNSTGITTQKYAVRTAFKSNPGCYSTDSVTIPIYPKPAVAFTMPDICLRDAFALFTDSTYTADSSSRPFTYQWNFGDAAGAGSNTSDQANPMHRYMAAANYNVQLKVVSARGCIDSLTKIFTVNGAVPKAGFTVANSNNLCIKSAVQLTNTSSVDFGNITYIEIWWDLLNQPNAFDTDADPKPGKLYSHQYPVFGGTVARRFRLKMRSYSGVSCVDEVVQEVVINPNPAVVFNAVDKVCFDQPPFVINTARDTSGNVGSGFFTGNGIDRSGVFNPAVAGTGNHRLMYTYATTKGCSDSASTVMTVSPLPITDAGPDFFVLEGGTARLEAVASGAGLTYTWSPAIYLNSPTLLQPQTTPIADVLYKLIVTSSAGCRASDSVFVKVLKLPVVPNAFSPNGDGINDTWVIRYLNSYPDCTVQVFNRYGSLVYTSTGYPTPWNGTYKGSTLPVGTYYYLINPKLGRKPIAGPVTLLR